MKAKIETITNLLLGAAYADKRLEGREIDEIRTLLLRLLGATELPGAVADQIASFNPAKFEPAEAAASLQDLDEPERRKVLEMVAAVHDADDEIDLDEDAYLRTVAKGLGIPAGGLSIAFEELDGALGDEGGNHDGNGAGGDADMGGGFGDGGGEG